MPALPRPDLPPGPHRELNDALHELHHRAGWPSLRSLASRAGCSHTTVSHAFSSTRLPPWGLVELLVETMDGDTSSFHGLWLAASGGASATAPVRRIAGRRTELAAVRRHLEAGDGFLVVTGEAGMGKTRLVEAAVEAAGDRVHVARGTCLPLSTQVPLLPVADVLREVHAADDGQWVKEALAGCPAYVAASLARLLPEVAELATVGDPDDDWARQRLYNAISTTFVRLAALRPLAVVVEDLHWADDATLDLLEHVVVRPTRPPLLGTWRLDDPDVPAATGSWWTRVRRAPHVAELPLQPLTRDETREQLLLMSGIDEHAVDRIHARTLGHPLFTEQLVAQARTSDDTLPGLLADLLDRRLAGLEGPAWQVARALGVADRPLPHGALVATTALADHQVGAALHELADHRLLADTSGDDAQLRHPLLAAAVRRRLVPGEAHDEHRRLARALAGLPVPAPAEVAAHWQAAGDAAEELPWRLAAAREADARRAGVQAAEHWTRVLELWPDGVDVLGDPPVDRPTAWFAAMDGHDMVGRPEQGDELVQQALREADSWPDLERAELLRRACDYRDQREHMGAGLALIDESIEVFRRLPASKGLARALGHKASVLSHYDRTDEARALVEESLATFRELGDAQGEQGMRSGLAWLHARGGRVEDALREIAEVRRALPDDIDPERQVWIGCNHTDLLLLTCQPAEEVEAAARPGLEAARRWRIESFETTVLQANVVIAWLRAGRVDLATAALEDAPGPGPTAIGWFPQVLAAAIDVLGGRHESARRRFSELTGGALARQFVTADLAALELWEGRPAAAWGVLADVLEQPSAPNIPGETGAYLALAARAAADLAASDPRHGSRAGRRELATRLESLRSGASYDPFAPDNAPADRLAAGQWAAELARLAGSESVQQWLAAAADWDTAGRPHDAAYCRWRGALVARRTGQAAVAERLLRRAARDAREHQPLRAAIRAAARGT